MDLLEAGQHLGALGQIERHDGLVSLHPLIDAELVADVASPCDEELLVEFV